MKTPIILAVVVSAVLSLNVAAAAAEEIGPRVPDISDELQKIIDARMSVELKTVHTRSFLTGTLIAGERWPARARRPKSDLVPCSCDADADTWKPYHPNL